MNRTILVICDMDEKYCFRLDEYIREYLNISFDIVDYTDPFKLPDFDRKQETAVLLIGQSTFNKVGTAGFERILVLDETESINSDKATLDYPDSEIDHIDKYQSSEIIVKKILDFCMKFPEGIGQENNHTDTKSKIHTFFSPVKRCMQTTVALNMAQVLAQKGKTLYISMEAFCGNYVPEKEIDGNIADLLYYYDCDSSKIALYLEKVCISVGAFDVIMPVQFFTQVSDISSEKWIELFGAIQKTEKYEYLIIDLSETNTAFLELLNISDKIYMITKPDIYAENKINQYEKLVRIAGSEKILEKTIKCRLPKFRMLLEGSQVFDQKEIAEYIKQILQTEIMDATEI
ncbi:MAG: hypothetical protein KA965_01850 [Butyrivibrio sp.]|nr:hypothetical protein [Butyrivibrio sp.]